MSANSSRARNQIATKPPQRFGTLTVECPRGGDVRKYTSAKGHTAKNSKGSSAILVLQRKYMEFCARFARCIAVMHVSSFPECRLHNPTLLGVRHSFTNGCYRRLVFVVLLPSDWWSNHHAASLLCPRMYQ